MEYTVFCKISVNGGNNAAKWTIKEIHYVVTVSFPLKWESNRRQC